MTQGYKLVKYSDNYGDEFDVDGWKIYLPEEWPEFKKFITDNEDKLFPFEYYFGTNEGIEYESASDFLSKFEEVDLDKDKATHLISVFGQEYGHYPQDYVNFWVEDLKAEGEWDQE